VAAVATWVTGAGGATDSEACSRNPLALWAVVWVILVDALSADFSATLFVVYSLFYT